MKESEFISQNKENWHEFEEALEEGTADPARTGKLFVQITDDLSYARTFYPSRSVRHYLNGVARVLFNNLNVSRRSVRRDFTDFWKYILPVTIYQCRRAMTVSLIVFAISFGIGVVSGVSDSEFAAKILGKAYVQMTEENILKGDPLAVYKTESELPMFASILLNNLIVDFVTFITGIFMAVGSVVVIVGNGVMIGVFHQLFYQHNLTWESFVTVWIHGSLEIPTIILSGGAGIAFGKGLLFPGTYSRLYAFRKSARDGLTIILGVMPLTFLAAFLESFLTRHTEIPDILRLCFIVLAIACVLLYYVYLPVRMNKSAPRRIFDGETSEFREPQPILPEQILTSGKIISETIRHFFSGPRYLARTVFIPALLAALLLSWNPADLLRDYDVGTIALANLFSFADYPFLIMPVMLILCTTLLWAADVMRHRFSATKNGNTLASVVHGLITAIIVSAGLFALLISDFEPAPYICFLLFPVACLAVVISSVKALPVFRAFEEMMQRLLHSPGKILVGALAVSIISTLLYFGSAKAISLLLVDDALSWIFSDDPTVRRFVGTFLHAFQTTFAFAVYCALMAISSVIGYFSILESDTAEGLLKRIKAL